MKYRPEIDGLRAVAVLPVILFHAGFTFFSGGYLGVDIFFVISGFLITSIILNELEQDKFTIKNFYKRRARRILPALFLVILVSLPFAWSWLLPTQLKEYSQSILGAVFFFSNFHFWDNSGYFEEAAEEKPLLHTWSLAVEEQYYIFFPLLLIYLWRKKSSHIPHAFAIIALLSLAISEYTSRHYPDANFYLIHTRAWEIFAGSIAAYYLSKKPLKANGLLSLTGLGLIIVSMLIFDEATRWPSIYTVPPILGTMLIILFTSPQTIAYKILSNKAFVGIGLISYSAYLWHQPLFAFARVKTIGEPAELLMAALAALSLILAFLSWKFVETPFRRGEFKLFSPVKGMIFATALLIAASLVGSISKGANWRYSGEVREILDSKHDYTPPREDCNYSKKTRSAKKDCWLNDSDKKSVLLIGDSHANGLAYELNNSLATKDLNIKKITQSSCVSVPGLAKVGNSESDKCFQFGKYIEEEVLKNPEYKTIVIHSRWTLPVEGERFDNGEGGLDSIVNNQFDLLGKDGGEGRKDRVLGSYTNFVQRMLDDGKKVILVYPIPEAGWKVPEYTAKTMLESDARQEISTSREVFLKRNQRIINAFAALQHPNLSHFRPSEYLCSEDSGRCLNADLENVYYKDDDHVSNAGVRLFAEDLADIVSSTQK